MSAYLCMTTSANSGFYNKMRDSHTLILIPCTTDAVFFSTGHICDYASDKTRGKNDCDKGFTPNCNTNGSTTHYSHNMMLMPMTLPPHFQVTIVCCKGVLEGVLYKWNLRLSK